MSGVHLGTITTRPRVFPSPRLRGEGQGEGFVHCRTRGSVRCEAWASSPRPSPPKEEREPADLAVVVVAKCAPLSADGHLPSAFCHASLIVLRPDPHACELSL